MNVPDIGLFPSPSWLNRYWLGFLILVSYLVLSANIGGLDIYSLDEARNAGCAYEMWQKGDFIVPVFNNQLRVEKPPLHYYFMMLAYSIFGFGEFSARFFSVIFGIATILITYFFALRYINRRVAQLASLGLVASLHFSIQIHMAVPDPYLIFLITASLMALYRGFQEKQPVFLYLGYLAAGLGYMTKGPIAVVFPAVSIFVFLIFSKTLTWRNIWAHKPFIGLLLMALVIVPWHIWVGQATDGKWLEGFYLTHNVSRFVAPMEGHGGIFLITWAYVLLGMLPFGGYIIPAVFWLWQNRKLEEQKPILFAGISALVIVLFFSFSQTKLPNYTVPSYPFFALLIGTYLHHIFQNERLTKAFQWATYFFVLIVFLLPVAIFIALQVEKSLAHLSYLAYFFLVLPIAGSLVIYFLVRKKPQSIILTQALGFILTIFIFFYVGFPRVDRENPIRLSLPLLDKTKKFVAYRAFNPAFVFYLRKEVKAFEELEDLKKEISQHKEIYVISREDALKELETIPRLQVVTKKKDIFEIPTTLIMEKK